MSEQQLIDRIERLEKKTRRTTVIAIGLSIALVCFACIAAAPNSDDVIVARGLKIVDAQGKIRADILVDKFDDEPNELPKDLRRVGLRLMGTDGKPILRLETMDGGDEKGKQQVYVGLVMSSQSIGGLSSERKDSTATISVVNKEAHLGVKVGDYSADLSTTSRSGAALRVRDQSSKLRIASMEPTEISIEDYNTASSSLRSKLNAQRLSIYEGLQGLSLGTTELQAKATGDQIKTSPTLVLFDKDGNVTWRAGR